jgi:PAS domain S-box-containing protein
MTRVLVVEDDAIISSDIAETLVRLGYEVAAVADSCEEALSAVSAEPPDVVLMDVQLRGATDGIETVTRLRRTSDIPVIYLTAHTDEATLVRAKETAPHGYLAKPFNDRDLRTSIEVAIRKHELERQLSEREHWFSTTLASLSDAVIATDAEGRVTFLNRAAEAITGFGARTALGCPLGEVFKLVEAAGEAGETPPNPDLSTVGSARVELLDRSGRRRVLDHTLAPIVNERGVVLGSAIVFRDVTERKRLERRLEAAERLASLGTMASGLAHELNNPLAAVMGNVSFALAELERHSAIQGESGATRLDECCSALTDAAAASERLRKIIETMRWYASRRSPECKVTGVTVLIERALRAIQHTIGRKARLVRAFGTTPSVDVDDRQVVQALVNLLASAADAIPERGAEPHEIRIATSTDDAGRAVIEILHDGAPPRESDFAQPFHPSFPTSPSASATGLRLAMSHAFVLAARGELTLRARAGTGGVFRISLPAATPESAETTPNVPPAARPHARILVVDDDPAVAKVIVRLLSEHHVSAETDPRAALARVANGETFDVIFCDLMMPELTGADVHAAIDATNPSLAGKMVFLTGGTFTPDIKRFLEQAENTVIDKPFSVGKLRAAIAAMFGG